MPNLVDIVEVAEALESKAVYLASDRCVVVRNRHASCAKCADATPLLSVTDMSTRLTLGLLIWPYILSSCLRLNGPLRPISCDAWYHPNREVNEEARAYPANAHDEKVSERQALRRLRPYPARAHNGRPRCDLRSRR